MAITPPQRTSALAAHYSRFRVAERLLLTGHSHQAWPDVGFEAQQQAWLDAAELVDDKWERAEETADDVRGHWRRLLGDDDGHIALGQNTHELVTRFLSAVLPMFASSYRPRATRPLRLRAHRKSELRRAGAARISAGRTRLKIVTSDGEFHTIRRQLDRLAEEGVSVVKEPARPVDTLAERMAGRVDDNTACVLVSSVLFETAEIVPNLGFLGSTCLAHGTELLVDAYHHVNVVPFDVSTFDRAFVVGGGYKYCQLGEGNCFLRVPPDCFLRPVLTGWFAEFGDLAHAGQSGEVAYPTGDLRFGGATYDPTSHYRAAAVFAFFERMDLTPVRLRAISQHQTELLADEFSRLDVSPEVASLVALPHGQRAGFVAIRASRADRLVAALRARGVFADARGETLRLGPAPYLSDAQLREAVAILGQVVKADHEGLTPSADRAIHRFEELRSQY